MTTTSLTPSKRAEMLEDMRLQLVKEEASDLDTILFMDFAERMMNADLVKTYETFWSARA